MLPTLLQIVFPKGFQIFRTLEFWRPDLGDLEAKNLNSLEDYPAWGPADSKCRKWELK